MKIIIVGSGFTGVQLAKRLVSQQNDVTLIDNNEEIMRHVSNTIDCTTIIADGNSIDTLEEAGIAKADALVCLTSRDEVNMITCSLIDAVYPKVLKIARVRNYAYYINTKATESSHEATFQKDHRPLYGIDYMIHPDVEAAEAITEAIFSGAVSNIITFDDSSMQISKVPITSESPLVGHKLMDLRSLCPVRLLMVYIEDGDNTFLPSGGTIIKAGTYIGIISQKSDLPAIIELCGTKQKDLRKIAIIGAGRIGTIVASKILEPQKSSILNLFSAKSRRIKQHITIIDSNEEKCAKASEKFKDADVFCGDATDESFLIEEGIPRYDLAVCATHNHELNMVLAAYLEGLGIGQSISLVSNAAFASIATRLGVDVSVSLRDVVVDSIMSHLRGKSVKEIHTITNGTLEIIECILTQHAKVNGHKVKDLSEHGKYLILLVKHAIMDTGQPNDYIIANGDTVIIAGDHLVIITQTDSAKHVLQMFADE